MRDTDIVAEINTKMNEACKLMAAEMVDKVRKMEAIPTLFGYCRPELNKPRKRARRFVLLSKETREAIRSQFGL